MQENASFNVQILLNLSKTKLNVLVLAEKLNMLKLINLAQMNAYQRSTHRMERVIEDALNNVQHYSNKK